jgi:CheY-like chemotaxis protein
MPPIKILLVDDDEVVRSSLDEVLQLLTLWLCSSDFATGRVSRYSGSRIAMIGSAVRDPSLQFIQRN